MIKTQMSIFLTKISDTESSAFNGLLSIRRLY